MERMGMLDGKTALVTGAGRGIGEGIAIALAAAAPKAGATELGRRLEGARGTGAECAQGAARVERVAKAWGRIDILVHVAAILRDRMIFNMAESECAAV